MPDLIEDARAMAEQLRSTHDNTVTALLTELCDALEECGYDLTGQWAARVFLKHEELFIPAACEQDARERVQEGRRVDWRWRLVHRTVGPWKEIDDA